ncbi:type II secretion system F family protein [Planctomycetota bacterium]|nr:type II secretion system F family protein [Planctomycetota bacterium]
MNDMVIQLALSLMVFSSVFLTIYAIFRFPAQTAPPVHRRFAESVGEIHLTLFENKMISPITSFFVMIASRFSVESIRKRVWQDLNASGNHAGYTVEEYIAVCLMTSCGFGIISILIQMIFANSIVILFAPLLFLVGFYIPLWTLRDSANQRTNRIAKQLPYTLDLISLTMASGASFVEAVDTLIRDNPDEDLNQELQLALNEIKFGSTRANALRNLSDRIPLNTLQSVIAATNQADKLGSPLAAILQTQADMLRVQRSVRAEKLAASASLRILIPSMLILIAVVTLVFSPLLIRFIQGEI